MKWKNTFIKSLKIAVAATVSIGLAGELGLMNSHTAGIITVLSIQNTKRETFQSARNRGLAFLCSLVIFYGCFSFMGYTLWAFTVYLFLFAMLCYCMGWAEAITMVSVLITHFIREERFDFPMILNEALIFLIGVTIGILMNLHLRRKTEDFRRMSEDVECQIKEILHQMSMWLSVENSSEDSLEDAAKHDGSCFDHLEEALEKAGLCAAANYGNSLFQGDTEEIDYIRMREQQSVVLKEIYRNIKMLEYLPRQAGQVADLLERIRQDFHRSTEVEVLIGCLEELLADMKGQELPVGREEFEARAILFHILMQLERLLRIKQQYRNGMTGHRIF